MSRLNNAMALKGRRTSQKYRGFIVRELHSQRKWIEAHGGSESGYMARYGSKDNPDLARFPGVGYYGDGGEAIWAADKAALDRIEADARRAGVA